jgi:hypothetical protein
MLLAPNIYKFFASAKPTLRALRAFEAIRAFNAMTESYCAVEAVGFLSRAGSSLSLYAEAMVSTKLPDGQLLIRQRQQT